ncbi:MAG TPA: glycosyltransferase [Pyrinomonadaceae bacterium]|nr:glycosyltransferase [Pyrinomonadaceae bacterium]
MKPRVLQLIGSFNNGGSERQAVQLSRLLIADETYDVRLAAMDRSGVLLDHVRTFYSDEIAEFAIESFFSVGFLKQARRCAKFINDNKIDIIHTHDFYTNVFGMAATFFARHCRFISSKRETGGMRTEMQDRIEKLAFSRSDAIVVNSDAVRSYLTQRTVTPEKIRVIYNGLDLDRFSRTAVRANVVTRLGLPDRAEIKFVTIVANLRHDVKNIPMLLRAAARLENDDVHFVVAGEGELRPSLEAMAAELGVAERVHFIGRCDDVPSILGVSFAGVLTSDAEGFSNSLLEYMAAALPVVATNVGGAAEIIDVDVNGYLVEPNDDAALTEYLAKLAGDADRAKEFGQNGKAMVSERFSLDSQLRNTLKLYDEVLGR